MARSYSELRLLWATTVRTATTATTTTATTVKPIPRTIDLSPQEAREEYCAQNYNPMYRNNYLYIWAHIMFINIKYRSVKVLYSVEIHVLIPYIYFYFCCFEFFLLICCDTVQYTATVLEWFRVLTVLAARWKVIKSRVSSKKEGKNCYFLTNSVLFPLS